MLLTIPALISGEAFEVLGLVRGTYTQCDRDSYSSVVRDVRDDMIHAAQKNIHLLAKFGKKVYHKAVVPHMRYRKRLKEERNMLITTTASIPGKTIDLIGLVTGAADSTVSNISGVVKKAKEGIVQAAEEVGADAIIDFRYELENKTLARNDGRLFCIAYGTAVKLVD